jgi:hypothetical protein
MHGWRIHFNNDERVENALRVPPILKLRNGCHDARLPLSSSKTNGGDKCFDIRSTEIA